MPGSAVFGASPTVNVLPLLCSDGASALMKAEKLSRSLAAMLMYSMSIPSKLLRTARLTR